MFDVNDLPEKGVKRERAIFHLCSDEANGPLLLELAQTEKGKCKTVAQKALAQLEFEGASTFWTTLAKGKFMGIHILTDSCSNCVSESIAPVIKERLTNLLHVSTQRPFTYKEYDQLLFCFALMLGKASPQMLDIYRYLASNIEIVSKFSHEPLYDGDSCNNFHISNDLLLYRATQSEMAKIPAIILTASIIKNPSDKLIALAHELYEHNHDSFLTPVFMGDIITKDATYVFEHYSPLLGSKKEIYLFNALGMLNYNHLPERFSLSHIVPDRRKIGMEALMFWANNCTVNYRVFTSKTRYINFDPRWYSLLATTPLEQKPRVAWQQYNRFGSLYESYDEMLLSILPHNIDDPALKSQVFAYFKIRSMFFKLPDSVTVYTDALKYYAPES